MPQRRLTRFLAPIAFLAAVTIGVVVVRAGLEHNRHPAQTPTTTATTKQKTTTQPRKHRAGTYTVQSGDTLGSIARKKGTTVARLEQLNPGIDPTALRIGQKIRVE
jgi:LysM repeat protein